MTQSEKFMNWLEGYLDASKNTLNSSQIKEIRKKIKEYQSNNISSNLQAINSQLAPLNEEYIKAIEKHKSASTLDELEN